MNLNAPATNYLSVTMSGPRRGKMYYGFDTKSDSSYRGSCKHSQFLSDRHLMVTINVAEGTVEEMLILEKEVLMRLNARSRPDFYNETNSNGFDPEDFGIELDYSKVSNDWINETVLKVLAISPESIEQETGAHALSAQLDEEDELLANFVNYVRNPANQTTELVPVVYSKLQDGENHQSRSVLLVEDKLKQISDRMRDELSDGLNPGQIANPIVAVTDKRGVDIINSGHHTITCLHAVGAGTCMYVVYPGELLNHDPELIRRAGERLNKTQHLTGPLTDRDCKFSLHKSFENYIKKQGVEVNNARLLSIFTRNSSGATLKQHFLRMKISDGYTSSQFDYAWKTLHKEYKMNKILNGRVFVPMGQVKTILGKTRKEISEELCAKYSCSHVAFGEASMAGIGSAHAAASRPFNHGASKVLLVLNQNKDVPLLSETDRNTILTTLKQDMTVFTRMIGSDFCPNVVVAILPAFTGEKLFVTELKDV